MLMVEALAGTGKTTTATWGMGSRVPKGITVSDEQKTIIKSMRGCRGSLAACAFNRSIADELRKKMPSNVDTGTSNAFGNRAWVKHLDISKCDLDNLKNRRICREIIGKSMAWKDRLFIEAAVDGLVSLCKCYLFDPTTDEKTNDGMDGMESLRWLSDRFDIEFNPLIADYTIKTFKKGVEPNAYIDYNDQIFLPLYHNVALPRYGHLLVDEVQDLNRAKQEMAIRMADRLTAIGDRRQAIYGFSGADSEAMSRLFDRMGEGAVTLPMTITRRCPILVVKLANTIVPELKAAPGAKEGVVRSIGEGEFRSMDLDPCMIVCRTNAPNTALAFKFIAAGKRCFIQGRDIGSGIKAEIKRTGENSLREAIIKVNERIDRKKVEIASSEFPDENKMEALEDKRICINILSADVDNIDEFFRVIDGLFKDSGSENDICLSSVHKAKGLEHEKIYINKANKLMLPTKKAFQAEQERNLAYVAYTRSMSELTRVFEEDEDES